MVITNEKMQTKRKLLSSRELSIFCEQMAMMIKSGIILHAGMQMITDDTAEPKRKALFQHISDALEKSLPLYSALNETGAFPDYVVHMTRIGSESGKLEATMDSMSAYYNRQHNMIENLKSAIIYPFILILMMLIVLIFLAAKVLPVFQQVFQSLGTEMSKGAVSIMKAGSVISQYSIILIVIVSILAVFVFYLLKTGNGRSILLHFIEGSKASERFSLATFTSSMAMMLSSGLDAEQSMQLSLQVISSRNVKGKMEKALESMQHSSVSFIDAIETVGLLSNATVGVLSMGSLSGSLDAAMRYISELYEEEYQAALIKRVSLIEPISIAVISVFIGAILISVMFPLLGILSSIG